MGINNKMFLVFLRIKYNSNNQLPAIIIYSNNLYFNKILKIWQFKRLMDSILLLVPSNQQFRHSHSITKSYKIFSHKNLIIQVLMLIMV